MVVLREVIPNGQLVVSDEDNVLHQCHWLEVGTPPQLESGDRLLMMTVPGLDQPLIVGKIGVFSTATVVIQATESLTLKCGDASVELRADGKAMVKGDDVLIRAKGTQRIRAGTVSIN
jgi:hypothetical protein